MGQIKVICPLDLPISITQPPSQNLGSVCFFDIGALTGSYASNNAYDLKRFTIIGAFYAHY